MLDIGGRLGLTLDRQPALIGCHGHASVAADVPVLAVVNGAVIFLLIRLHVYVLGTVRLILRVTTLLVHICALFLPVFPFSFFQIPSLSFGPLLLLVPAHCLI
jgi:hypothetical protein